MISPRGLLAAAAVSVLIVAASGGLRAEAKAVRHRASRATERGATQPESRVLKRFQKKTAAATPRVRPPSQRGAAGGAATAARPDAPGAGTDDKSAGSNVPSSQAKGGLALERLSQGPSMYETGKIAEASVVPAKIRQTVGRPAPRDLRVERKAYPVEQAPAYPGAISGDLLDRELAPRFILLRNCRSDVARARRIAPAAVTASRLTLRWTIQPDGSVTDTLVVATSAADGKVMDCVKRQMILWRFSFPDGGTVRVERPFRF